MRKLMAWILAALMALSGFAFAEAPATSDAVLAVNGSDAVRVGTDLYLAIPNGMRQMLVRVPTGGGDPACVDRGDRFEDLIPYGNGIVYLKTDSDSSAIMSYDGASVKTVYGFGTSKASCLGYYGGRLLVLIDGLLHSVEPGTQLCLRLSGSEMRDYVLGNGVAYFLSVGDSIEYPAQLEGGGEVTTQAGCVYSLDLNSGETTQQLKSGCEDLAIVGDMLYFHNLADLYAVRTAGTAQLRGHVYGLNVRQRSLTTVCSEPDNGFWAFDRGPVVWYDGALNIDTEAGKLALYAPEASATVVSDGENLYAWEPIKGVLTQVQLNGTQTAIYTGDLTQAKDIAVMAPVETPDPSASAAPAGDSDVNPEGNSGWFDSYMDNQSRSPGSSGGSSSSGGAQVRATPIGTTPTPAPIAVPASNSGSTSSGSGSSSSSGGSSSSGSSGGTKSSGSKYSVNMSYVRITGGSVNVRTGPGTGYSIITSVHEGTVLKCTGTASKDTGGNTWYQVSNGSRKGWVSAGYAKKTSSSGGSTSISTGSNAKGSSTAVGSPSSASGTLYTTGSVHVRSGAGLDYKSKGTLKSGTAFKVSQKQKDTRGVVWYKGSGGGLSGWVSSAYLSGSKTSSGGGSSSGGSSGGGSGSKLVTTGKLTIRSKPNKTSKALGYIGSGKTVSYLNNKAEDNRGVVWYFISYKGVNGWISSRYSHFK